jgi:hypothetical protein
MGAILQWAKQHATVLIADDVRSTDGGALAQATDTECGTQSRGLTAIVYALLPAQHENI